MNVWIVSFETGEYSDRVVYTDCCFADEAKAREYAETKNVDVQAVIDAKEAYIDKGGRYSWRCADYPFNGDMYEVRSYFGDRANPFSVSGPYEVKE